MKHIRYKQNKTKQTAETGRTSLSFITQFEPYAMLMIICQYQKHSIHRNKNKDTEKQKENVLDLHK